MLRIVTAGGEEMLFSEKYACPDCGISIPALTPVCFFNSPYGACPDCNGLGSSMRFTEYLVVPDAGLSLRDGAIAPWPDVNLFISIVFWTLSALITALMSTHRLISCRKNSESTSVRVG